MIAPLLTRVRPDISGSELSYLFDTFAANYYQVIDYINKSRIGINYMPAIQNPMTVQPSTAATQPSSIVTQPSKITTQPKAKAAKPNQVMPKPAVVMPAPAPAQAPPKVMPKEKPKIVSPPEETNRIKLEKREVNLEERKPMGPPTLEDEPLDKIKQEANLENKEEATPEEQNG